MRKRKELYNKKTIKELNEILARTAEEMRHEAYMSEENDKSVSYERLSEVYEQIERTLRNNQ